MTYGCAPFPARAHRCCASAVLLVRYPPSLAYPLSPDSLDAAICPFLYPLLVGPPPWRPFFAASHVFLCVARLFPFPTSSLCWSSLSCVARAFHLCVVLLSAPSWSCETWTWVLAVAGGVVMTMRATTPMQSLTAMTILRRWRYPFGLPSVLCVCVAVLRFPHLSIPHPRRWRPTKRAYGQGGGRAQFVHERVRCPCLTCPCLLSYLALPVLARVWAPGTGHTSCSSCV